MLRTHFANLHMIMRLVAFLDKYNIACLKYKAETSVKPCRSISYEAYCQNLGLNIFQESLTL